MRNATKTTEDDDSETDNDDIFPISFQKKDFSYSFFCSFFFGVCTIFFLHVKKEEDQVL